MNDILSNLVADGQFVAGAGMLALLLPKVARIEVWLLGQLMPDTGPTLISHLNDDLVDASWSQRVGRSALFILAAPFLASKIRVVERGAATSWKLSRLVFRFAELESLQAIDARFDLQRFATMSAESVKAEVSSVLSMMESHASRFGH